VNNLLPDINHMLFLGPPGVGKTVSARRMASLLYEKGLLPTDKCVSIVSEALVGQYVGETPAKVRKILQESLGGCLLVDEAHRLDPGGSSAGEYKKEALGVLMEAMTSPDYENKILIIFAGYEAPINRLLATDGGLSRRFKTRIVFKDLNAHEAIAAFNNLL